MIENKKTHDKYDKISREMAIHQNKLIFLWLFAVTGWGYFLYLLIQSISYNFVIISHYNSINEGFPELILLSILLLVITVYYFPLKQIKKEVRMLNEE
jgi:hypothetical protein